MEKQENTIDLRRLIRAFRQGKWIFLAIIIIFTALGAWKGFRGLSKYEIQGSLLIGDSSFETESKGGGILQMMKTFSVGGFSGSSVDNELLILRSHDVLMRTVRSLDLNRSYIGIDKDGKKAQLYKDTPIRIEAPANYFDTLSTSFTINVNILKDGKANIKVTKKKFFIKKTLKEVKNVSFPYLLETPLGAFQILATESFKTSPYKELQVAIMGNEIAANIVDNDVTIDVATKLADVIDVEYDCANDSLGKATVNGLMTEYNTKRLNRLHETSSNSIKYYDERIAETFKALQASEKNISDYQKKNDITGTEAEIELLVENSIGTKQAIQTANYNIAYYETVLDILRNRLNDDVIIPQMESLNDPNVVAFNEYIEARRDMKRSATDDNEALIRINEKIETLRDLIIENSTKMIAKAKTDVRHQESLASSINGRLSEFPDYQIELLSLMREKEFQNQLYLYLIGQRENSVLQHYSSQNIGYIYQPAYVVKKSGILKKMKWPAAMFILSVIFVTGLAIILMWFSRKVKNPMDLAFIGIDGNSLNYDGKQSQINALRTKITANPMQNVIYWATLNGTDSAMTSFADSLASIGRHVDVITELNTNDDILKPETQNRIKSAIESAFGYAIVLVPKPEEVSYIENAVDSENACLVVSLPYNQITRKQFKAILKGQTANKIYALIVNK